MTRSRRSEAVGLALLAIALAAGLGPTQAEAQAPAAEDPKAVFAEAQNAYQLGHFLDAIGKYERVFEITQHPSLLFNLAQCHRQLLNYERAAFFYDRYLATAKAPIPNEDLARDLLAEMSGKRDRAAKEKADSEQRARDAALAAQLVEKPPPAVETKPVTSQVWFWAIIGGGALVVAGTATAIAVGSSKPALPDTSLGSIQF